MIVQPDFCEHWKTRLLVEVTGDESAPMAVLRLWAHCQHCRRALFPDMTPAQLASICHWEARKPACHVALLKAGFIERLKPRGFAAHEWNDHNRQLLQKWEAGALGGRPLGENSEKFSKISENFRSPLSESQSDQPGKTKESEKPTGNRPTTGPKLDRPDRPDRPDRLIDSPDPIGGSGGDMDSKKQSFGNRPDGLDGLVGGIASKMQPAPRNVPSLNQVLIYLQMLFPGADRYAKSFYKTMQKQRWRDKDGKDITNWQAMAKAYASKAELTRSESGTAT